MAKKLKVWLNNKLNKRLRCITELVLTFFLFKYPDYFEFPKGGKRSPHFKILEIPGGRAGIFKDPLDRKILGGGGGGRCKSKCLPWGRGYGYFL